MAMTRSLLRSLVAALGLAATLCAPTALAQAWPARPVKIIVPFATGGPADNYARFIAQRLTESLGQSFVVDNKPGAGSVIGTDIAAKSPADGYTLLLMSNAHTVNETLIANKPFALARDFVGVAPINYSDLVLVAHPSLAANNIKELMALAKDRPGKLNYASSGPGTPYHMAGELFKSLSGVYLVHIPYRGSSGARTDVIGGQVDMMFDAVTTMAEQIKAGKVKAYAITTAQRVPALPDLPTMSEAGMPDFTVTIWHAMYAPKGTPKPVIDKLSKALQEALKDANLKQRFADLGSEPVAQERATPEALRAHLKAEIDKWGPIIKKAGVFAD